MTIYKHKELSNFIHRPEGKVKVLGTITLGMGKEFIRTYWQVGKTLYMRDNIIHTITCRVEDPEHRERVREAFQ